MMRSEALSLNQSHPPLHVQYAVFAISYHHDPRGYTSAATEHDRLLP